MLTRLLSENGEMHVSNNIQGPFHSLHFDGERKSVWIQNFEEKSGPDPRQIFRCANRTRLLFLIRNLYLSVVWLGLELRTNTMKHVYK